MPQNLGGVTTVILAISIRGYGNTLLATLSVQRKELAILQSLVMTKDQLWKMIFFEGIGYWSIIMFALGVVGNGVKWILCKAIKNKLLYFKFMYPWQALIGLSIILIVVCFIVSCIFYSANTSITDNLWRNDD